MGRGRELFVHKSVPSPPNSIFLSFLFFVHIQSEVFSHHGAEVGGGIVQFFFDAQQLVVLGGTVGAAQGAGLNLSGIHTHGKVGDEGVFGFARTVGNGLILI